MMPLSQHMISDKRRDHLIASVKTAVKVPTNVTSLLIQVELRAVFSTNMVTLVALTPLKQVIVSIHSISRSHQIQASQAQEVKVKSSPNKLE